MRPKCPPAKQPATHSTKLSAAYTAASFQDRRKNVSITSNEKVEKVVKPPQTPTAKNTRAGCPHPRSIAAAENAPSNREPITLIKSVGQGNSWTLALQA